MAKPKQARIIYVGRRFLPNDEKICHAFLDGKEECLFGAKVKWCEIGKTYLGEKKTSKDLSIKVRPEESETQLDVSEDQLNEWMAKDAAAEAMDRRRKVASRFKSSNGLARDVQVLKKYVKGLRFSERRAFVEYVMDHYLGGD